MTKPVDRPHKKTGRPEIEINWLLVEKLAAIFCTEEEIAAVMDVGLSTLKSRPAFLAVYKKGMDKGRASLRRTLWRHAQTSFPAAIYLSKQKDILGYTDVQTTQQSGRVVFEVVYDKGIVSNPSADGPKIKGPLQLKEGSPETT